MKQEAVDSGRPPKYVVGNSFEQSSALKNAPDSARGAVHAFSTARFYCVLCKELRRVKSVSNEIHQLPTSAMYNATLSCEHSRIVTLNVRRPQKKQEIEIT